jgi:hypothetical protein
MKEQIRINRSTSCGFCNRKFSDERSLMTVERTGLCPSCYTNREKIKHERFNRNNSNVITDVSIK